ncbi:MAG: DUF2147 domain-containing protein [Marinoscillum sp.]
MKTILFVIATVFTFCLSAQSIVGKWKTIDDETGKPRSVVQIEERNGKYYGKIVQLFREPREEADPICDECPGKRKNQKVIGMEIITAMEYDASDKEYEDGEILDPESGSIYDCKLWIEGGNLKVRGYIMFLFRTQTWLPYEG